MKILAIDGNSIMNRAFYGIRLLSTGRGEYTNALTGFMNIFLKVTGEISPDGIVAAFDLRAPTFRHKAVESYKANRKGMPEELASQMPLIKQLLTGLGVAVLELEGYEADDILGTVSRMAQESGGSCSVLTGDRDSLQLISDSVTVLLHSTKELIEFTPSKFEEVYGFAPINLIDLKALMGDSSDNISGVAGIGEKTASALIKEYGTIEAIYADIDAVNASAGVRAKLAAGREAAAQSKWLATIDRNVPLGRDIASLRLSKRDDIAVSALLSRLEMFKLLSRLKLKPTAVQAEEGGDDDGQFSLSGIGDEAKDNGKTSGREISAPAEGELLEFAEGTAEAVLKSERIDYILKGGRLFVRLGEKLFFTDSGEFILDFLCSEVKKRTFDAKPSYKLCISAGRTAAGIVFDGFIAAYLINSTSSEYTISRLCAENGLSCDDDKDGAEIAVLSPLCDRLENAVERNGFSSLLYDVEQPLTEVLASMECLGVGVDIEGVRAFGDMLTARIAEVREEIFGLAGHEFNIASTKQLGTVLFEEMGLPSGKKTKTGYSTGVEVLESLADLSPIIPPVLEYRKLTKLSSTYVDGLSKEIAADGRIHSSFNQTETRTGRISSAEPNLQNIPVRTDLGREMRRFFKADGDMLLLDADYSQIELRILAHMSGDRNMIDAFNSGMDIHTATAAQVFGMPLDMVTDSMRRSAKAVNFGIVYGIGAFSLSKDIGVTVAEADRYIKNYLSNYSGVDRFMKETVSQAEKNGYVTTMFGRRRYIPELMASNKNLQAFGRRAAMNAPVQGTAADIIKIAMVRVFRRLRDEGLDARLILQVHDELIIECAPKDKERAAEVLSLEMRSAAKLDVEMTADVSMGKSWYDAKG